ncbi:MAG: hypothetical protein R3D27_04960 [Hyphomicrobiaceae bacterium]
MHYLSDERTISAAFLAVAVLLGLTVPSLSALLKPVALPALLVVVVLSLVPFARMPASALLSLKAPVLRIVAWQQFALPGIVIAAATVLKVPEQVVVLMVVTIASGALFASPALAELLHLNRERALQCMVLSTLLTPVSLFIFLNIYRDAGTHILLDVFVQRVAVFLIVPFLLFAAYRILAKDLSDKVVERVSDISRWGVILALVVFCIGIMSDVSNEVGTSPRIVIFDLIVASMLCCGMLLLTIVTMWRYGADEALTAGILCGFRNVGLGYALVGEAIGHQLAVYVGVSMLPMFLTPVIIRVVYTQRQQAGAAAAAADACERADGGSEPQLGAARAF